MAEGIRIRHHTRRSQVLPVPLLSEPWPWNKTECGACHTIHPCKVIHLTLDDTGAVIVSAEIKDKIFGVPARGGFHVVNPVLNPPAQGITPPTVKIPIRGVEIGGGLQAPERNRRYATTTGDLPDSKTVSLNEYVDIANRHGISTATALNVLMMHLLGKEPNGDNRHRRTPQRATR